jgi:allantoinase
MDLVITGGKIFTRSGLVEGCIAVNEGKILAIGKETQMPTADRTIDVSGNIVLPGMIDLHVHFRDPGAPEKEDFKTGTSAAACGGVTTIMDMPNTIPPTVNQDAFRKKVEIAKAKAIVDFALCGGVGVNSVANVREMANAGASAYKTFMTSRFEELFAGNDATLLDIFTQVSQTTLSCFIHAESQAIVTAQIEKLRNAKRTDPNAHTESRPPIAEAHGSLMALSLAKDAGARLHICHTSIPEVVEYASLWRKGGQSVTIETCPHYLLLTHDLMNRRGAFAKIDPPLRSEEIRQTMWNMFVNGHIDTLASDHAPYTIEEKEHGRSNIFDAPSGSPGVETTLPVMLDCVSKGILSIERLVQAFSITPAKITHLYPRKGNLQIGADADFVIVDMKKEMTIKAHLLHSKQKYSLFEDRKCRGWPLTTIVRGNIVADQGEVTVKPGCGKFIKPNSFQTYKN